VRRNLSGYLTLVTVCLLSACGVSRPPVVTLPGGPDRTAEFTATCRSVYLSELLREPDAGGLEGCINQARGGKTKDGLIAWIRTSAEYIALHTAPPVPPIRPGQVTFCGAHGLCDAAGRHYYGGATLFWAAWGYAHDRARLDEAMKDLAPGAHDFARILGHVTGPSPYWDDRHHDLTQPGAVEQLGATVDYLADHGLRTWFALFGDVSYTPAIRSQIVDASILVLKARQSKLMLVEVVNEGLALKPVQFPLLEAQGYARRIASALPGTLVVVTSPKSETCADLQAVALGNVSAPHFSRSMTGTKGAWTPPAQPWMGDTQPRWCGGRVTVDGEPIGIGSSVSSDNDRTRLAMAPAVGAAGGLSAHVLHSTPAGVYGRVAFHDQPGWMAAQESVRQMRALINKSPDLQDWARGGSSDGPWTVRDLPNDKAGIKGTVDRLYCTWRGAESWCAALDVRATTTLTAKQPMHVSVHDGAAALTEVLARDVNAGESITLTPATPGAVVIGTLR
jgi:hypothetical protein